MKDLKDNKTHKDIKNLKDNKTHNDLTNLKDLSEEGKKEYDNQEEINPKVIEEILLEKSMRECGADRYDQRTTKAIQNDREEGTSYGSRIIKNMTNAVAKQIEDWVLHQSTGRGRKHNVLPLLKLFESDYRVPAAIALRGGLQGISSEKGLVEVARRVGQYIEDELQLMACAQADPYAARRIDKALRERGDQRKRHDVIAKANERNDWGLSVMDPKLRIQLGIVLLKLVEISTDLFETRYKHSRSMRSKARQAYIRATPETLKWIREHRDFARVMSPVLKPMVCKPLDWSPERTLGGGYLSRHIPKFPMVKRMKSSRQLNEIAQSDMPKVYKAMNAAQSTGLKVNKRVLEVLKHFAQAESDIVDTLGLPRAMDYIVPERPVKADEDKETHKAWKVAAAAVHSANSKLISKRVLFHANLATAEQFQDEETLYVPYQTDFRGRIYGLTAAGLSPQGPDYVKALLCFAEPCVATEENIIWLELQIANSFGIDKVSFEERIEWVRSQRDLWLEISMFPTEQLFWAEEADGKAKFQALAAIFDYAKYLMNGPGVEINVGFAMDGSCSGLQHLGLAFSCEKTGKAVNLMPADKPQDIYQEVCNVVIEKLRVIARGASSKAEGERIALEAVHKCAKEVAGLSTQTEITKFITAVLEPDADVRKQDDHVKSARKLYQDIQAAEQWLRFGLTRKVCKRGVMTYPYGSAAYGMVQQIREDTLDPVYQEAVHQRETGKITREEFDRIFPFYGDGHGASMLLGRVLFESVQEVVLKASEAMNWLQDVARLIAKGNGTIRWTTDTGFPVIQDYRKSEKERVQTRVFGDMRVQLELHSETEDIDSRKQANSIAPNVVHSLDATHLVRTVSACVDEGIDQFILVHDSFMTSIEHSQRLFEILREQMYLMYEEGAFEDIAQQLIAQVEDKYREKIPPIPLQGKMDRALVMESLYTFA